MTVNGLVELHQFVLKSEIMCVCVCPIHLKKYTMYVDWVVHSSGDGVMSLIH